MEQLSVDSLIKLSDGPESSVDFKRIQSNSVLAEDQASATFALADMYRRDGRHDEAFSLFLNANALSASSRPFDFENWEQKNLNAIR